MGRMSKFTFPVPGRKQKQEQNAGPVVSGSMSKAQKILGTTDINLDPASQWDRMSTQSGISISVSESTASHNASQKGLQSVNEEGEFQHRGRDEYQWEQESETVPAYIRSSRFSRKASSPAPGKDMRSETSSLQRRTSSSTIMSWYDKAKMPLSISQQTSASAMAKGLPPKAKALLDVDNSKAPSKLAKKKKPARLDLSHLIPGHRHHGHSTSTVSQSSLVLGPDYVTKSPSIASTSNKSPGPTSPPIKQRTDWKPTRNGTHDRRADAAATTAVANANLSSTTSSSRKGATDSAGLKHLYDHYEQASFRSIKHSLGEAMEATDMPSSFSVHSLPPTKTGDQFHKPTRQRPDLFPNGRHARSHDIFPPTPVSALPGPSGSGLLSLDRDCAASVSSRHTKTSKASKRTNRSFGDSDLQEKSMLSLSSDSEEDDYPESASKSAMSIPSIRWPANGDEESSSVESSRRPPIRKAQTPESNARKPGKHASFAPESTFLTIPIHSPTPKPLAFNLRSSSLPMPRHPPPVPSIRSSSRLSTLSTSTANSNMDWKSRSGYAVHEARAVAVLPASAKARSFSDDQASLSSRKTMSTKAASLHSGDQPTPPLSPTSVDFYIGSAGSSIDASGNHNPRFMAVTRQEEMLLAALRTKRARMRENIISEYEEDGRSASQTHHTQAPSPSATACSNPRQSPQTLRHQTSATSNSTVRQEDHMAHKHSRQTSVGDQNTSGSNPQNLATPASTVHSDRSMSSKSGNLRTSVYEKDASPSAAKQERVLLFLDRRADNVNALDQAEPSPDLSDFMDFDDGSEDDDEVASDEFMYLHAAGNSDQVGTGVNTKETVVRVARRRPDSTPLSPKSTPSLVEQVRVVEADADEDAADVPRPDSPVSPDGAFPMPAQAMGNKKSVRLSAVGRVGMEVGWWGDDG